MDSLVDLVEYMEETRGPEDRAGIMVEIEALFGKETVVTVIEKLRMEVWAKGREEGLEEGARKIVLAILSERILTGDEIARRLHLDSKWGRRVEMELGRKNS